jgi:hypothetical protein
MDPLLVGTLILLVLCTGYTAARCASRAAADRRAGVTAEWEGLRITSTELIDGYRSNATRHRLSDLCAAVLECRTESRNISNSGSRYIHVTIEGPDTYIDRTLGARCPHAEAQARAFAANLNQARQQLQHY